MSDSPLPQPGRYKSGEFASEPMLPPLLTPPVPPAGAIGPGTEMPPPRRFRFGGWFLGLALCFLGVALVYDAVAFVWRLFTQSAIAGTIVGALLVAALVAGTVWIVDEIRRLYGMKAADRFRLRAARLRGSTSRGEAVTMIAAVAPSLRGNEAANTGLVRLQGMLRQTHSDADVLDLFVREVLDPLDRQASVRIARAARDTAIGVAASPVGLLDAVIGIARALRMVREIATIYGLRPGTFGSLRLLRRILLDGAGFATADLASDAWTEILGGVGSRVTGMISGKLGEGVFAAVRMTRLGLAAMQACRPVPFADEQRLSQIRRELIGNVFTGLIPRRRRADAEPSKPAA